MSLNCEAGKAGLLTTSRLQGIVANPCPAYSELDNIL